LPDSHGDKRGYTLEPRGTSFAIDAQLLFVADEVCSGRAVAWRRSAFAESKMVAAPART
jgi:hypothetical protein